LSRQWRIILDVSIDPFTSALGADSHTETAKLAATMTPVVHLTVLASDLVKGRDDCVTAWIRTYRKRRIADEDHPTGVES